GADGDASVEGDGLTGLARQVGEQTEAVDAQQVEGLGVAAAEEERLQVVGQRRPQRLDFLGSHGIPSAWQHNYPTQNAYLFFEPRSASVLSTREVSMQDSVTVLIGMAALAALALAGFAIYRWRQRERARRVDRWVRDYLAARYGGVPDGLHINCSDDRLWP